MQPLSGLFNFVAVPLACFARGSATETTCTAATSFTSPLHCLQVPCLTHLAVAAAAAHAVALGILLFFLSENLVSKLSPSHAPCGHSHSLPAPKHPRSASPSKSSAPPTTALSSAAATSGSESQSHAKVILLVLADLLHNFTDGLALGVSWCTPSRAFLSVLFRLYSER